MQDPAMQDLAICESVLSENGIIILHDVGVASPGMDITNKGGVRRALSDFGASHPDLKIIYFEYPLWPNECGLALVCKQRLDPPIDAPAQRPPKRWRLLG